jgi:hypothetical protein
MARYLDDGGSAPVTSAPVTVTPELASALEKINADVPVITGQTTQADITLTPYTELTPAERASMTQEEKVAYLEAARDQADANAAAERAASNPMYDFSNRPDAPQAGNDYINYYSWQGDTNSGQWKLYRAPNTPENQAAYGSRSVGGPTQAQPGNPQGANALVVQPQPVKDKDGNITGWTNPSTGTTTTIVTPPVNPPVNPPVVNPPGANPPVVNPPGVTSTVNTTGLDPATKALIDSLQSQIAALTKATTTATDKAAADKAAADAIATSKALQERQSTITVLQDRFAKYGLTGLAQKIKDLAIDGATEATITLQLQETPEYQQRFAANAERVKKGLAVLTPAEYLNVEDSYRQVLRAYGLKQFDTDAYVRQFIANDMSPTELSNRVVTAVQRVQNADPAIQQQLKDYYGVSAADMVGYVLDPEQSFQKIQRQIAASEIGVAGARQGLEVGVSVADQLAAQGVTQAEAQKGYSTIADILPTAEKLSGIYGKTMDTYGQSEGEQEVFNSLASAQRKRQKLTAAEQAQFSGSSGVAKGAFSTGYLSKQSSAGQF